MSAARGTVVIVAAGDGTRLGADVPKALVPLGGSTLLRHGTRAVLAGGVPRVVVVHHPEHRRAFEAALAGFNVAALVPGGATRTASVQAGVRAALAIDEAQDGVIAVHDAARCLTPPELIRSVLDAVDGDVIAAAPGRPVSDTLKVADADGNVEATRDREGLWAVHTPQAIATAAWRRILDWAGEAGGVEATDDLALVEQARAAGVVHGRIRLIRSSGAALKVTWPADLATAAAILADRASTHRAVDPASASGGRSPADREGVVDMVERS